MIKHNNRCTLCLTFNKRTLNIFRTNLQYVYENLANLKVRSETWMCFICHEKLRQCHLLQQLAINTRGLIANICEVDTKFESLLELSTSDTRIICLPSPCETQYAAAIKTEPDETSEVHLNDTENKQDKDVETTNYYEDGEQNPGSSCADSEKNHLICDDDTLKVDRNNSRQMKKELLLIIEKLSPSIIAKFVRSSPEKRREEHFEEGEFTSTSTKKIKQEMEEVVGDTGRRCFKAVYESRVEEKICQLRAKIRNNHDDDEQKKPEDIAAPSDDDYYSSDHSNDRSYCIPETEDEDDQSEYSGSDTENLINLPGTSNQRIAVEKDNKDMNTEPIECNAVAAVTDASSLVKSQESIKRKREKDFCFYCESFVLNFARHVFRNHYVESEVQKALSAPKNSKLRKNILTDLRKKGNFITNTQYQSFKPMKKSKYSKVEDYVPCTKCLGLYARKQLWKHKKKCDETYSNS